MAENLIEAVVSRICENTLLSAGSLLLISWLTYYARRSTTPSLPLPPGPKPHFLIGNLLHIPLVQPWKVYNEWRKQYGDVFFMSALGRNILVVNSVEAAQDLLVERAANYSNRPYTPVVELIHFDWAFPMMNVGTRWREQRRMFHRALNHPQTHRYHPVMEQEMRNFLPRLLADPKDHRELLRFLFAAIIMRVSYGSEDYEYNKGLALSAEELIKGLMTYTNPARLLVNVIPSLRFVPAWVPFAGWQRTLAEVAKHSDSVLRDPYNDTKERVQNGTQADHSALAVQFMEMLPEETDPHFTRLEENARHVSAVSYAAGADSSVSAAFTIILALARNPRVQRRAQEALDTVIGAGRLPTVQDLPHLPYITAIVKESMRWHTILPLGFPHCSVEGDVYNGYHIPAGTYVLSNPWAIMNDPAHFDQPSEFRPERYLKDGKIDPSVLDPDVATFGWGRRVCPGRQFSIDSLELMVATILMCFNIDQSLDENGNPIVPCLDLPKRLILAPNPFECDFVPRSKQHIDLIHSLETK